MALEDDISTKLPKYFSQDGEYGSVVAEVSHKGESELADGLRYREYELNLKIHNIDMFKNRDTISQATIPVTHVYDWPDLTASSNK